MNEKNYDYLKNQVKFLGFGDTLEKDLGEKIKLQPANFTLEHQTKFGEDRVDSVLTFQKSKESEMYFFNSFDMAINAAGKDDTLRQTYYVGKENNLTLKERYNMLEGRAVFKEFNKLEQVGEGNNMKFKATDETYQAWTQLNFKQTDENGNFLQRKLFGFDLEKILAKYPIKELEDNYDKNRLIASLEKGNRQTATLTAGGIEQKISIEANPLDKGLKFYDSNMQRLEVKQNDTQKQQQGQNIAQGETGAVQKEDQKQSQKHDLQDENKQTGQRKRSQQKIS
ncbi:hypothetical protein SAMN05216464_113156 [Mucilaginibacter pineti]|uniref:DUF3945 domain-containing protein n=1 Tax=Mucilaginibacter pineti TaxID=1391627 RepID=A0A1G7ITE2_9SPHI|nr:hypothetical protein [Mucilaginibacter pineti]SDF15951.1 hypothetical protein SAMN05216464_113156 [Mucilaginibacter pineti]